MAKASQTDVSTTAVAVATAAGGTAGNVEVLLYNAGTGTVFISDDSAVTTLTGFAVTPGQYVPYVMSQFSTVYAISASGTNRVHALKVHN